MQNASVLYGALATLVGTPVAALLFSLAAFRARVARPLFRIAMLGVIGTGLAMLAGLRFTGPGLNALVLCAAYLGIGYLTMCAFRFRPRLPWMLAGTAGALVLITGLLTASLGTLALRTAIAEATPVHVGPAGPGLHCVITRFGNDSPGDSGREIRLQQPVIGSLGRVVWRQRLLDGEASGSDATICAQAAAGSGH